MKKVLISQRIDFLSDRNELRDSVDQKLIKFAEKCGFTPVPVPNTLNCPDIWIKLIKPDGIILSGGNHIGDYENRDFTESRLLFYAKQEKIPVLGICRGMQFMAKANGSILRKIDNHVKSTHHVWGEINCQVNSFHEYTVSICSDDFRVIARASFDNSIEAIRHNILPWEGWMWHPERNHPFQESDIIRLTSLFA